MVSTVLGFPEGMSHRSISATEVTRYLTGRNYNEIKAI